MKKIIAISIFMLGACASVDDTPEQIAARNERIRNLTIMACATAPTASQIAQLYVEDKKADKKIKSTEQAALIMCATLLNTPK